MGIRLKKKWFISIIICVAVLIIALQYKLNIKINNQPPSPQWAKGKYLTNVSSITDPKILKSGKDYIVAIDNEKEIKVLKIDYLGKVLKKSNFKLDAEKIRNINLGRLKNGHYYIEALAMYGLNFTYELDENFKVIQSKKMSGVTEASQADESIFVRAGEDYLEILNLSTGRIDKIKAESPINIGAAKYKDKYIITYMNNKEAVKEQSYFYYKDGKLSESKKLFQMPTFMFYSNPKVSMAHDGRYMHFMTISYNKKGEVYKKYTFDLEKPKIEEDLHGKIVEFPEFKSINRFKPEGYYDGKARFFIEGLRDFGTKKEYEDMGEFTVKGDEISPTTMITKSYDTDTYNCAIDDIIIYSEFSSKGNGLYDVYMTSQNNEFKALNNNLTKTEKSIAIQDTFQGVAYIVIYILLLGTRWIIPALVFMGIFTLVQYRINPKLYGVIFAVGLTLTAAIKTFVIYRVSYGRFKYYLPSGISFPWVGILFNLIISFMCYFYALKVYKEDIDALPSLHSLPAVVLDSVLTLLIFTPYLPG
ncbi:hypothetical protein [Clostridium sp. KNHs214]|uniref:hypothetical protein n=1 Tax=Clostridium sp. KNHs214 TaxID=1540257 RepID=UPI00054FC7D2|nr:hypothetical protein [Clostridium sp. KNHs214]